MRGRYHVILHHGNVKHRLRLQVFHVVPQLYCLTGLVAVFVEHPFRYQPCWQHVPICLLSGDSRAHLYEEFYIKIGFWTYLWQWLVYFGTYLT